MARIKKTGGPRHNATRPPAIATFVDTAVHLALPKLPAHLATFPSLWPFPRGDLYHWIPLLDRFDRILELFNQEYDLRSGPQTQKFARRLLLRGDDAGPKDSLTTETTTDEELEKLGFEDEGDRQLVEAVLSFSRLLLQNCGNRSLYSSSTHLNDLLNTSSLALLHSTLRLTVCLAQRYHASRTRTVGASQHVNLSLLASHYNISLDMVQKIAVPFTRSMPVVESTAPTSGTPTSKGKEKAWSAEKVSATAKVHEADFVAMIQPENAAGDRTQPGVVSHQPRPDGHRAGWDDWGDVLLSYYPAQDVSQPESKRPTAEAAGAATEAPASASPTLGRRASGPWQQTPLRRIHTPEQSDHAASSVPAHPAKSDLVQEHQAGAMRILQVSADTAASVAVSEIMASAPTGLPKDVKYELLSRLRVASALVASPITRQQILAVRILAITNLAYIYPEHNFQQKVLLQDTDEPRRLQLAYQLAELVHPSGGGLVDVPRPLQTLALGALEAMAKYRTKAADVCAALNVNVNHGVLYYATRKAVSEMNTEDVHSDSREDEEWREALFALLAYLPTITRTSGPMVSAGLLPILLEVLTLRSDQAERILPKVVDFLNIFIYNVRDPFQTLANAKGLDILSALVAHEVESGFARAQRGEGVPKEYRTQLVDYDVPYFQQQTLRRLFKFVNHMMSQNGLTLDRLLRNLIDSPQLLGGLKLVVNNSSVFGSSIWSGAVEIIGNFIHNEPTSYAVVAEAGLGKAFLEAVSGRPLASPEEEKADEEPNLDGVDADDATRDVSIGRRMQLLRRMQLQGQTQSSDAPPDHESNTAEPAGSEQPQMDDKLEFPLAAGIPPSADAILMVPHGFGAICLNAAGMKLFQRSRALQSFFEIFLSAPHIECMESDPDVPKQLGNAMDELIRHHPPLKKDVILCVRWIVRSLRGQCESRARTDNEGAKFWKPADGLRGLVAGGQQPLTTQPRSWQDSNFQALSTMGNHRAGEDSDDVEMTEASGQAEDSETALQADSTALPEDLISQTKATQPTIPTLISPTMTFLAAFFANNSACSAFIERGGAECLLDFASLSSLPYHFSSGPASLYFSKVVHMLVEQKPHLVLPSLVRRTQEAVDKLAEFSQHKENYAYFGPLCRGEDNVSNGREHGLEDAARHEKLSGTALTQCLVTAHILCNTLSEVFSKPLPTHRSSHTFFSQVNLSDMYVQLIRGLGELQRACIMEDILLQKGIPPAWRHATRAIDLGIDDGGSGDVPGVLPPYRALHDNASGSPNRNEDSSFGLGETSAESTADVHKNKTALFVLNYQTLHYLLNQLPSTIAAFLHGLGKSLVSKRLSDSYQKQNSVMVAEAIAEALIDQLRITLDGVPDTSSREAYLISVLTSLSRLIIEVPPERTPAQCLTLVLQAFKSRDGFDAIGRVLAHFASRLQRLPPQEESSRHSTDASARVRLTAGLDVILTFYLNVVASKNIVEAAQTMLIASRDRSSREKPDFFLPNQFVVELRASVLSAAQALWESNFIEKAAESTIKKLISILHVVLEGDNEQGAYRRSETLPRRIRSSARVWKEPSERRDKLLGNGYAEDIVREALYRCNDNIGLAEDYCKFVQQHPKLARYPIPEQTNIATSLAPRGSSSGPQSESAVVEAADTSRDDNAIVPPSTISLEQPMLDDTLAMEVDSTDVANPSEAPALTVQVTRAQGHMALGSEVSATGTEINSGHQTDLSTPPASRPELPHTGEAESKNESTQSSTTGNEPNTPLNVITVDDLEDKRTEIRQHIIDLSLDVLNVHSGVTFDLADLIMAAVSKATNAESLRGEIGETLVQSIVSLQMEDDFRPVGKKVAAYAHLLALLLREKSFHNAITRELKGNLSTLLEFIKIFPDQSLDDPSPWIGHILVILERLLAEDSQPRQIKWTSPTSDSAPEPSPIAELGEPIVSDSHRTQLLESILEILPRIGKDSSLALSVVRVLVLLTRHREMAIRLGEKRNLQRLFVMVKQLAGLSTGRLQNAFMLVLRHIVEDDDTIKQIMRSAIQQFFESRQASRQVDVNGYVRGLSAFVLRAPDIFVEVTNDMLRLVKFEPNRPQLLTLKQTVSELESSDNLDAEVGKKDDEMENPGGKTHDRTALEQASRQESPETPKPPNPETKTPVLESSDGVIHYMLCELLSYKEVDDKETTVSGRDTVEQANNSLTTDVEMTEGDIASGPSPTVSSLQHPVERPHPSSTSLFKADQHPIFMYRCFILQCMSELLSSYTKTKLEFINFSRRATSQAITATKPKSGVLNYFLTELIPIGTLNHAEDVNFRKKYSTSHWAISTIVSLCSKTGEKYVGNERTLSDIVEEPELLHVRKFVLDHCLRAYRDAIGSSEALDAKYARILSLADLFNRMLIGSPVSSGADANMDMLYASQKLLAKLMFEKNFIPTLTASIAEIDLNYPLAKRAVKYVLRPLKLLTQTAIELSEFSSISSNVGQPNDDEIDSPTSASDIEEEREETPDLFRNSTLGLFEPGREAESSSGSSEDEGELYDDEYGDVMEYEEEISPDQEVFSDEDEGIPDMEGLPGDVGLDVEVTLHDDEDNAGTDDDDEGSEDVESDNDADAADNMDEDANDSGEDDDNEEWESDDADEADYEGDEDLEDEDASPHAHHHHHRHDSPLDHIVRALEGDDGTGMLRELGGRDLDMDLDPDGFMDDDMQEDEDLSEQDDDEDDLDDDEEVVYDQRFDGLDGQIPSLPWVSWNSDGDESVLPRGHTHSTHHHLPDVWGLLSGGPGEPRRLVPTYRSHRPGGSNHRVNDDGTHPLLQRSSEMLSNSISSRDGRPQTLSELMHNFSPSEASRGLLPPDLPTTILNNLISAIGHGAPGFGGLRRHGGAFHFHVSGPPPRTVHRDIQALLGIRRTGTGVAPVSHHLDPAQAITFVAVSTTGRWQDESRILYGQDCAEKAYRIVNSLLSLLVPPAIQEEKIRKEKMAAEDARKAQEEKERKAEEERAATKKAEEERESHRTAEERGDQETRDENAENTEVTTGQPEPQDGGLSAQTEFPSAHDGDAMEGVETTPVETHADATQTEPSASVARVRTTIRGRELDITGMDIDPEYLDALPEELREEVLMHQIAERRSQAATTGEQPTNISREFLAALPDDIREELLEQEAQDRRRREREEARRRAAASSGPAQPGGDEMDPASVLATLEPGLRQAILMEQDEDVLAQLPQEIAAEARALGSEHRLRHNFIDPGRINRARAVEESHDHEEPSVRKPQRKTVVQMLDKAGIATLLRLMFIPQQGSARHTLNSILQNICENKQNRTETVSLLLSILQDGSADIAAVDRSFAQLSLRARQPASQKLQNTTKRAPAPQGICDISPLAVVQQCLNTLVLLVQYNPHLQSFFLTEHDLSAGLKRAASRKGKSKESKASKYALNSLLGLLDRKLVMESPTIMEQLSTLLNSITQPLGVLLRKDRDANADTSERNDSAPARAESISAATPPPETLSQAMETTDEGHTSSATGQAAAAGENMEPMAEEPTTVTSEAAPQQEITNASEGTKTKRERNPDSPFVPEYNLRLVVNILTARECSAKTFRDTLSTINNLSAIHGAKQVFGMELLRQAQVMGQSILGDLSDLVAQIKNAHTDTDVQGLALAKFSPASSPQAKLLRVLTALDYLFDTQRESDKTTPVNEGSQVNPQKGLNKGDLLATLSNDSTFGPLWGKLSECLGVIRQNEHMLNLATILLPLIEALMVVCKNTALKNPTAQRSSALESSGTLLGEDAERVKLEDLFFTFTEEHRKILNDLVRHNPKLMSGTFSLLVRNPKVLEFDNKRNYFTRRLHTRGTESRHSQPPLQLSVRRDQVFLDSFKSLYFKTGEEMKYGKLSIRFHGEEGVDAGGVTREWFQVLSRQMFNADYALFTPVAADRTTFHPNRLSAVNPEHYMFFKFIGRIIGKALYEGRVLDCHFSRAVYKRILGKPVSVKDMETLDLDYYKSLVWMLENDITDIITETFSVETEAFGETQVIDLKEDGRNIPVNESNKQEYVRLVVEYRLTGSVQGQLEHFLNGFHDIVPAELISIFNEQELELLISGLPDIDVDDWKNNTEYHNYSASSPQIQWFWRAVRSFDKEERAKLLQFVTGTSKVPLNGFKELEGMNGFSRFNIHRDYGSKDRLPSSHTCFNQLDLPEYESYESLRQQVYTAMTAGSEYFGFA